MKVLGKKIKTAPYNPRTMNKDTKDALLNSMEEFEDISGIVINSRTGHIVSGNHRWQALIDKFGNDLELTEISDEYSYINADDEFTGFIAKIVDWPLEKEKAANITANSDLLSGTFTSELQTVLDDVSKGLDDSLFGGLRLDELQIDLDGIDEDLSWDDDQLDNIQKEAEDKNNQLENAKGEEAEDVTLIRETIKISVPSEMKQEIKDELLEFLATKTYYGDITII